MRFNFYPENRLQIARGLLSDGVRNAAQGTPTDPDYLYAVVDKIAEAAVAEVMMRLRTAGLYWCPRCDMFINKAASEPKACDNCHSSLGGKPS